MSIDMSQFFQVFFDEADELLAKMEKLLLEIEVDAPDTEDLHAIFRAVHSIKGGAATFGMGELTQVAHVLETLLDKIRQGEVGLTTEHVDAFLAAKDVLKMQLDSQRLHTEVDSTMVADIRILLESMAAQAGADVPPQAPALVFDTNKTAQKAPETEEAPHVFRVRLPASLALRDVDVLAAELGLLGEITRSILPDGRSEFRLLTTENVAGITAICSFILEPDALNIVDEGVVVNDVHAKQPDVNVEEQEVAQEKAQGYGFFPPFESGQAALPPQEKEHVEPHLVCKPALKREEKTVSHAESSSIRVGVEKVDQLINLAGELVITQAMMEEGARALDPVLHERMLNSISQLTRNTRDLQEAVMSIRMMPMDYVFSRFPRMVRDLAAKLGKKVEFVTHGAATELDKGLIERIVDPLTHLVRNSVDHGIELPEVRTACGKAPTGRLSLSAAHQGGNIVIEVSDDGAGLNRERILDKARQNGLAVSDDMRDADVWQLIFAPGFSTAQTVTDVSGRGVGMDVVKRNITSMGGAVEIASAHGQGTTMSISLPLTLAILDGMSIKVGDEIYILPLGYVIESLQPQAGDIREIASQGRVVKVRGEYLPLIPLYRIFDIEPRVTEPSNGIVVILESEGRKAALFVDELVGQQQVVVKNMESNYRKVAGISGATILGDGGVALIIDVVALLRSSRQLNEESIYA